MISEFKYGQTWKIWPSQLRYYLGITLGITISIYKDVWTQTMKHPYIYKDVYQQSKKKSLNYLRNLITNNKIWHQKKGSNFGICRKITI